MFSDINPTKILKLILKSDLLLPIFLLFSYILFLFIARGVFPSNTELINTFARLYAKYGYEIIFISAFFESLVLVNLFVPGGITLALGVIFARAGEINLEAVILIASIGAICGYLIDYFLGLYGFSQVINKMGYGRLITQSRIKLHKYGNRGLILGFIHANIASFFSFAAGTINFRLKTFIIIAITATFFWFSLWALAVYAIGDVFLTILRRYGFLLILFIIGGTFLSKFWEEKE